eukprot:scaffold1307_cov200-Pinguiococcus_pyrenoidosus.AAC.150
MAGRRLWHSMPDSSAVESFGRVLDCGRRGRRQPLRPGASTTLCQVLKPRSLPQKIENTPKSGGSTWWLRRRWWTGERTLRSALATLQFLDLDFPASGSFPGVHSPRGLLSGDILPYHGAHRECSESRKGFPVCQMRRGRLMAAAAQRGT